MGLNASFIMILKQLLFIITYIDSLQWESVYSEDFSGMKNRDLTLTLGQCKIVIERDCPHPDVSVFLYTWESQYLGEVITDNLLRTNFNPSLPTKILLHGYNSDMFLPVLREIKREYFLRNEFNIFMVDWSSLALGPCYPAAVWNTRFVGKCTARLVENIQKASSQDIHLIGFSLGAHVAGFAGSNLKDKPSRITGLDPAMPGFTTVSNDNKLDASDAHFVDILHTNAFLQGTIEQSGHVDFYVNGGVVQPGCWAEPRYLACNHHRAPIYFAESINSKLGFWGWSCPSYFDYLWGHCLPKESQIVMGEQASKEMYGIYLVITNSVSPFAVGKYTGPLIEIFT